MSTFKSTLTPSFVILILPFPFVEVLLTTAVVSVVLASCSAIAWSTIASPVGDVTPPFKTFPVLKLVIVPSLKSTEYLIPLYVTSLTSLVSVVVSAVDVASDIIASAFISLLFAASISAFAICSSVLLNFFLSKFSILAKTVFLLSLF